MHVATACESTSAPVPPGPRTTSASGARAPPRSPGPRAAPPEAPRCATSRSIAEPRALEPGDAVVHTRELRIQKCWRDLYVEKKTSKKMYLFLPKSIGFKTANTTTREGVRCSKFGRKSKGDISGLLYFSALRESTSTATGSQPSGVQSPAVRLRRQLYCE